MVEDPIKTVLEARAASNVPHISRSPRASGRGSGEQPEGTLSVAQLATLLDTTVVTIHRHRRRLEERTGKTLGSEQKGAVYMTWEECLEMAHALATRPGQLKKLADRYGTNPGTMRTWVRGLGIDEFTPDNLAKLDAHARKAGYPGAGRKEVGLHSIEAQPGEYNTRQVGEKLDGLSRERIRQLVAEMNRAGIPVGRQYGNGFWYFTESDIAHMKSWRNSHRVGRRPKVA
jgi:hypothetical protein